MLVAKERIFQGKTPRVRPDRISLLFGTPNNVKVDALTPTVANGPPFAPFLSVVTSNFTSIKKGPFAGAGDMAGIEVGG